MGFKLEPCPFCKAAEVKLTKVTDNFCHVECQECKVRLEMKAPRGALMDCARTWNTRAQRRSEMLRLNMNAVSLLHADIFDNQEGHEFVTLDNTDETWGIAVAAELATDDSVTPVRSVERLFKIRYDVLFPFLDALVFESAEKTPRVREND